MNNAEKVPSIELELVDLEDRRTDREVEWYLFNHDVCGEYLDSVAPEECDVYETFSKMSAARNYYIQKGRHFWKFEPTYLGAFGWGKCAKEGRIIRETRSANRAIGKCDIGRRSRTGETGEYSGWKLACFERGGILVT